MAEPLRAEIKRTSLFQIGDIVRIELHCGDELFAAVLFEDIAQRLRAGEGITLTVPVRAAEKVK